VAACERGAIGREQAGGQRFRRTLLCDQFINTTWRKLARTVTTPHFSTKSTKCGNGSVYGSFSRQNERMFLYHCAERSDRYEPCQAGGSLVRSWRRRRACTVLPSFL